MEATLKWTGSVIFGSAPSPQTSFFEYIPPPPSSLPPTEGAPCVLRVHLRSHWDDSANVPSDVSDRVSVQYFQCEDADPDEMKASKGVQSDSMVISFVPKRAGVYKVLLDGVALKSKKPVDSGVEESTVLEVCTLSLWKCRFEMSPPDVSLLTCHDPEANTIQPTAGTECHIVVNCRNSENDLCQAPSNITKRLSIMFDDGNCLTIVHNAEIRFGLQYVWLKFMPEWTGKYRVCIDDEVIRTESPDGGLLDCLEMIPVSTKHSYFEFIPPTDVDMDDAVRTGCPLSPIEDKPCQIRIFTLNDHKQHTSLPLDVVSRLRILYCNHHGDMILQYVNVTASYTYATVCFTPAFSGIYKIELDGKYLRGRSVESDNVEHLIVRGLVSPAHSHFIYIAPKSSTKDIRHKNFDHVEPLVNLMCSVQLEVKDDKGQATILPQNFSDRVTVYQNKGNHKYVVEDNYTACFKTFAVLHFTPNDTGVFRIAIDDVVIKRRFENDTTADGMNVVSLSTELSSFEDFPPYFEDMECAMRFYAVGTGGKSVCLPSDLSSRLCVAQANGETLRPEKIHLKYFTTYADILFKPTRWGTFRILLDNRPLSRFSSRETTTSVDITVYTLMSPEYSFFEFLPRRPIHQERSCGERTYHDEPLQGTRCTLRVHARDGLGNIPEHLPTDFRSRIRVCYKPNPQDTSSQTIKLQEYKDSIVDVIMTPEMGGIYHVTIDEESIMKNSREKEVYVYGVIPFDDTLCGYLKEERQLDGVTSYTMRCPKARMNHISKKFLVGKNGAYLKNITRVTKVNIGPDDVTENENEIVMRFQPGDPATAERVRQLISHILKASHHRHIASEHQKKKNHFEILAQDALEFERYDDASYLKKIMHAHAYIVDACEEIACESIFTFFNTGREINKIDLQDMVNSDQLIKCLEKRLEDHRLVSKNSWLEIIFDGEFASCDNNNTKEVIEKYLSQTGRKYVMISAVSLLVEFGSYTGSQPCYGQFYCTACDYAWVSRFTWVGHKQTCAVCKTQLCLPHKLMSVVSMASHVTDKVLPEPEHDRNLCEKCHQVATGDCTRISRLVAKQ